MEDRVFTNHHKDILKSQMIFLMREKLEPPEIITNFLFKNCEEEAKKWFENYLQECLREGQIINY